MPANESQYSTQALPIAADTSAARRAHVGATGTSEERLAGVTSSSGAATMVCATHGGVANGAAGGMAAERADAAPSDRDVATRLLAVRSAGLDMGPALLQPLAAESPASHERIDVGSERRAHIPAELVVSNVNLTAGAKPVTVPSTGGAADSNAKDSNREPKPTRLSAHIIGMQYVHQLVEDEQRIARML